MNNSDPYTPFYSQLILGNTSSTNNINNINISEMLKDSNYLTYSNTLDTKTCPIGLDEFKEGDSIVELPCKHIFLKENILNWLKNKHTCPVCRYSLSQVTQESQEDTDQYHITHRIDTMIQFLSNRLRNQDNNVSETLEEIFEIY